MQKSLCNHDSTQYRCLTFSACQFETHSKYSLGVCAPMVFMQEIQNEYTCPYVRDVPTSIIFTWAVQVHVLVYMLIG